MAGPEKRLCSLEGAGTPTDGLRDRPSYTRGAQTLRFAPSRNPSAPRIRPGPTTVWGVYEERTTIGIS